jgi:choline dehydrogenase-like flavoprotein
MSPVPAAAMPSFAREEVDVCIVGSGAGGAPLALELARAGARVVVLEKGPWYHREDFDHDEIANTRLDKWVPNVADEPHLLQLGDHGPPRRATQGWIANCVGGGTAHWSGFVHRMHPDDFRLQSRYGSVEGATIADWPIGYDDLAPYYDKVEHEIGVSGEIADHPFAPPRAGPYPLPPLDANPLSALIDQGARRLGLHPFATPRAILSRPYGGRPACIYCDFCGGYGCEVDAKSGTAAALIPRALATGRCELRPRCMAFEVSIDQDGRARSVRYYDAAGKVAEQRARVVCISATAIESARLLLNSTSSRFPRGLANGSGLVGKNLTFSTLAEGSGEFEVARLPPELRPHHKVHFLQRSLRDFYFIPERHGRYDKGGTLNFVLPHRNPIATADRVSRRGRPPLWGEALSRALRRYYDEVREIAFEVFGEFLPNPGTFVTVEGEVKDRWQIPSATIHVRNHPADVENSRWLLDKGLELLRAAGAGATVAESAGTTTFVLQHGTCRFGTDPTASVLDKFCRSHEVPNLYVVDGSFMPTSGGVPSTLTIMANAFRVADHLVQRLRSGANPKPHA